MRRVTWIALIALLFGPLPWVWRAAVDTLDEIDRKDAEARATVAADGFLSALSSAIEASDARWLPLDDPASIAIHEDPLDDALSTPEIARVRARDSNDLLGALELLDRWIASSRSVDTDVEGRRDVESARIGLALIEASRILRRAGHFENASRLLDRASHVSAPHPSLVRYYDLVRIAERLRTSVSFDAWLEQVETGATSLGALSLMVRTARDFAHDAELSEIRARASDRARWPLWQDALKGESGEEPRVLRALDRWFTLSAGRFRVGPDVDLLADTWRGPTGERVSLEESSAESEQQVERSGSRGDLSIERPLFVAVPRGALVGGVTSRSVATSAFVSYAAIATLLLFAIAYQLRRGDRLVEARDDLIAQVAHELRTPLTVLRLYGESLLEGRVPPDARDEYLRGVGVETKRLGTLVDRMIRSVRGDGLPDSNGALVDVPSIDVVGLTDRVVEDFDPVAKDRSGGVRFTPTDRPSVRIAEDDLRMILEVLLDNGLKYGGDHPKIEVEASSRDRQAWVTVRDHGSGLEPGEEQKIFERFARGRAGRVFSRGAGMGLYLARRAARNTGGDLVLRNAEGDGAVAELTLPLSEGAPETSGVIDGEVVT